MHRDLDLLFNEISTALDSLSAREAQAIPLEVPQKWSIQEIMEHLRLTYVSTAETLENRLGKGRPTLSKNTAAQRIWKVVILRFGYFPPGEKSLLLRSAQLSRCRCASGSEMCHQNQKLPDADR